MSTISTKTLTDWRIDDVEMQEPKLPLALLTPALDGYEVCRTRPADFARLGRCGSWRLAQHSKPKRLVAFMSPPINDINRGVKRF
jgi:hypothetical protein